MSVPLVVEHITVFLKDVVWSETHSATARMARNFLFVFVFLLELSVQ